jgi:hypothetical protein
MLFFSQNNFCSEIWARAVTEAHADTISARRSAGTPFDVRQWQLWPFWKMIFQNWVRGQTGGAAAGIRGGIALISALSDYMRENANFRNARWDPNRNSRNCKKGAQKSHPKTSKRTRTLRISEWNPNRSRRLGGAHEEARSEPSNRPVLCPLIGENRPPMLRCGNANY